MSGGSGLAVRGLLGALAVLFLVPPAAASSGLAHAERRGQRIYREGTGAGPIRALLGSGIRAPGTGFPCIACHMEDGAGTLEGGVRSADITWPVLSKEFEGLRPSGRAHPPYDDEGLKRAITAGLDPAGNVLHEAHPRYTMDAGDLGDLAAYLKVLGSEPVPGVTDNEIRIGILVPAQGPLAGAGAEVRALLAAYFGELNAAGGLFRRALTLVPVPFDPLVEGAAAAAARGAVEKDAVFSFLGNLGVSPGDAAARVLAEARVPVIAPLLSAPGSGYGEDRYTFHILASLSEQARVMVDFLSREMSRPVSRIGLLCASDRSGEGGAAGVRAQAEKHSVSVAVEVAFPPGALSPADAVRRLREKDPEAVVFFGGGRDFLGLLEEADRQGWRPVFAAPAPLVGGSALAAPAGIAGKIFLSTPFAAPDGAPEAMAELAALEHRAGAGDSHRLFQLLAYAGAKVLAEGLRRSGRAVTREKFVSRLEALYEFPTGVTPPLTYDANRRVGARGAAILGLDPGGKRFLEAGGWREPR